LLSPDPPRFETSTSLWELLFSLIYVAIGHAPSDGDQRLTQLLLHLLHRFPFLQRLSTILCRLDGRISSRTCYRWSTRAQQGWCTKRERLV
jgi:hypothetical protein